MKTQGQRQLRLAIVFDNEHDLYWDLDVLKGNVKVIVNQPRCLVQAIRVELCGFAVVHWGTSRVNERDLDPDNLKGDYSKEQYFHKSIHVLEKAEGGVLGKDPVLEPGIHSYPFEFKLPPELPSSFEGEYGQVRYFARATIERPRKSNVVTKKGFTVLSGLNLNFIPEAACKIDICKYKQLGGCCSKGNVIIDWNIHRSGFVPGEDILVNGAVQNESKVIVAYSKVTFFMVIEYKTKKGRQKEKRKLAEVNKGETRPQDVTVWQDALHIPPLPPTGLSRCTIMDVNYEIEFKALLEGGYSPIVFTKDIYIGTVPMCRREMRSCVAGMFNQPYSESVEALDQCVAPSQSQASLTHVIAQASARTPKASPTAPALEAGDPGGDPLPLAERPPPYAPHYVDMTTAAGRSPTAPSAPSALTLMRPWRPESPDQELASEPRFESSSVFGPVSLEELTEDADSVSLRGELTFIPVYAYFGTLPSGAQPLPES